MQNVICSTFSCYIFSRAFWIDTRLCFFSIFLRELSAWVLLFQTFLLQYMDDPSDSCYMNDLQALRHVELWNTSRQPITINHQPTMLFHLFAHTTRCLPAPLPRCVRCYLPSVMLINRSSVPTLARWYLKKKKEKKKKNKPLRRALRTATVAVRAPLGYPWTVG